MNIAYLIICHKNPEQVIRLISRLKSENATCFVHVDAKADFDLAAIENAGGILTNRRYHGVLFNFLIVQITNELLSSVKEYEKQNHKKYKYFCLLSGQDYLLQRVDAINGQLEHSYPMPFIDCTPWGKGNWIDAGSNNCRWFVAIDRKITMAMRAGLKRKLVKAPFFIANRLLRKIKNVRSLIEKNGISLYGGSAWWILPDDMVDYLLEVYNAWDKNNKFYPLTFMASPDETYYQTILMNSPFKSRIAVNPPDMVAQNCKTYANFLPEGKKFTGHPYILTYEDRERLRVLSQDRFFARKFDEKIDADVFDWIDQNLLL